MSLVLLVLHPRRLSDLELNITPAASPPVALSVTACMPTPDKQSPLTVSWRFELSCVGVALAMVGSPTGTRVTSQYTQQTLCYRMGSLFEQTQYSKSTLRYNSTTMLRSPRLTPLEAENYKQDRIVRQYSRA